MSPNEDIKTFYIPYGDIDGPNTGLGRSFSPRNESHETINLILLKTTHDALYSTDILLSCILSRRPDLAVQAHVPMQQYIFHLIHARAVSHCLFHLQPFTAIACVRHP